MRFGRTPLLCSVYNDNFCVVQYLVHHGAYINAKDNRVEFLFLMTLRFIGLQQKGISEQLNYW